MNRISLLFPTQGLKLRASTAPGRSIKNAPLLSQRTYSGNNGSVPQHSFFNPLEGISSLELRDHQSKLNQSRHLSDRLELNQIINFYDFLFTVEADEHAST